MIRGIKLASGLKIKNQIFWMIRESANIVVYYLKKLQTKKYNLFIIFIN
jgi:hypothetical protein